MLIQVVLSVVGLLDKAGPVVRAPHWCLSGRFGLRSPRDVRKHEDVMEPNAELLDKSRHPGGTTNKDYSVSANQLIKTTAIPLPLDTHAPLHRHTH